MYITVKNRTPGPVSLPGPLPRLRGSTNIQETITTEITPDEFDRIKDELGILAINGTIETLIEPCGSFDNRFQLDDKNQRILHNGVVIAAPGTGTDELVKVSITDTTAAYLGQKLVGNGISTTLLNPGFNEQLQISPTYGSGAGTVCEGNDSRLSNARTPLAHGSTHKNSGGDEVATATAAANAIPKANASSTLNSGWIDDTSHGNRGGGSLHSVVIAGGANGFMSGTDKTKLDNILSSTAPVNVTRATADAGSATDAAKRDHKHDVSTAAPTQGIGGSNSAGSASTLISSDHDHKIRETGGPTDLTVGIIADGQTVRRTGAALVGYTPASGGVKEVFFEAESSTNLNNMRTRSVSGIGTWNFNFAIPLDFGSLVSIHLLGVPAVTNATADIDLTSNYGAVGESPNTHTGSDTTSTYSLVANILYALNLAPVLGSLAAGDFGGVNVDHNTIGGGVDYYGIRLRYNPA